MSLYRPLSIGSFALPGNLFQAPVAGYSDRAFRSICIEQGADFTCTELISSEALVRSSPKTETLLARGENEKWYGIQIFGAEPGIMARAAALLAPYKPAAVDINCGCPVPKVIKTGAGSALLKNPLLLGKIVEAVVTASATYLDGTPVTVKIRSGWDDDSVNYRETARVAVESGAALVALHARTRVQGYSGTAEWSHIADLADRLSVPVVGSGDLFSPEAGERMLRETGCAGIMFARGAMGNPFIFSEVRSLLVLGRYEAVPPSERLNAGLRQLGLLARDRGEAAACRDMRKQFCAYTKGMEGGSALRNRLVYAESIAQYHAILRDFEVSGAYPIG